MMASGNLTKPQVNSSKESWWRGEWVSMKVCMTISSCQAIVARPGRVRNPACFGQSLRPCSSGSADSIRGGGSGESPRRTEPNVVRAVRRRVVEAADGTQEPNDVGAERATAQRTATFIVHFIVFLRISFIFKPPIAILAPLPDVAVHIKESPIIRPEHSH